ncbi:MAG: DUF2490 domain-containing protein [Bacteroidota bacterium]|nr:DUF2490 domain-containing protein [Bacteroidota bacterium]
MKNHFHYILLLLFLLLSSFKGISQLSGEWLSAGIKLDLPKKFSFGVSGEARILNNSWNLYKYFSEFELGYKINKRFDISVKYRVAWRKEENMHFYFRSKFFADIKFDYPVERFKIENRFRYTRRKRTYITEANDFDPDNHIRNKFKVSYNIRKSPVTPIIFCELFFPLSSNSYNTIDQYRLAAEAKFPLHNKQSLKAGIMYMHEQVEIQGSVIIFRLSYNFSFKL